MCDWGDKTLVLVKIPADLLFTDKEKWRRRGIDSCIAPLVSALQRAKIDMRGSCCAHGKGAGYIALQDGRYLVILQPIEALAYEQDRLILIGPHPFIMPHMWGLLVALLRNIFRHFKRRQY